MTDAMAAEFDTVAAWTADVAVDLGPDYYVPAGCRGSGSPSALSWLVDALHLTASDRMLDGGAGVGGPAAFAGERAGVRPVLAEPESGACRAAGRLFDLPVVRADAASLPFATASFDVAWCLGVLCTTEDQAGVLAEMRRVLIPGGRLGLLVFTATANQVPNQPEGNNFPTSDALRDLLLEAGLRIEAVAPPDAFDSEPRDWQRRVDAVDAELDRRHHDDDAWRTAQEQSAAFGRVLAAQQVAGTLLVARSEWSRSNTVGDLRR